MKSKILFFDDIFSEIFRGQLSSEDIAMDDSWVNSVEQELVKADSGTGVVFDVCKSGDIETCCQVIEKEKPDAILLDLFWPEQSRLRYGDRGRARDIALEALGKIRRAFPSLPVVCFTVKPDRNLLEEVYEAGATFFLEKIPLSLPEVHSTLKYVLVYFLKYA
jgi:CheY-like chemotaxis protein